MNCPCCFKRIDTSGGCSDCMLTTIWCSCGLRVCGKHGQEEFKQHACPNIQTNGTIIQTGMPWVPDVQTNLAY